MNRPHRYRVFQSRKTNHSVLIVLKKDEAVTIGEEYKEKISGKVGFGVKHQKRNAGYHIRSLKNKTKDSESSKRNI
jgi:hypothetical protein